MPPLQTRPAPSSRISDVAFLLFCFPGCACLPPPASLPTVPTRSASTPARSLCRHHPAMVLTQRRFGDTHVAMSAVLPLGTRHMPIHYFPQCRPQPSLPTVGTRSPARAAAIRVTFMHRFPCSDACMHAIGVLLRRSYASRDAPRPRTSHCRNVYVPRPLTRLLGSMALQLLVA